MNKFIFVMCLCLVGHLTVIQAQWRKKLVIDPVRKKKGEELWELAIAAKGGRERLEQVKSVAYFRSLTDGDLIVFPDKFFRWTDARGTGRHGFFIMSQFNLATGIDYSLMAEGEINSKEMRKQALKPETASALKSWFKPWQLYDFLGLKWFYPRIVDWQRKKYNGKIVDWVRLYPDSYAGDRDDVGVYLDLTTHLPLRFEHYAEYSYGEQTNSYIEYKDYKAVKGIMMPTKVKADGFREWSSPNIEIDPEYDPTFFDKPPDPSLGFNQWRLKK